MADETYRANLVPQPLFHVVTDRAATLTFDSKAGQPILAKDKHLDTICAHTSANSPILLKESGEI